MKRVTIRASFFIMATWIASFAFYASPRASAALLISQPFTTANAWSSMTSGFSVSAPGVTMSASQQAAGTIDVAGSTTPSGAIKVTVANTNANTSPWTGSVFSGLLPVTNTETNLGKLTLSFDTSISSLRPIAIQVSSWTASYTKSGSLQTTIYPAAANFYQRTAIELSSMAPAGGTFTPTNPLH